MRRLLFLAPSRQKSACPALAHSEPAGDCDAADQAEAAIEQREPAVIYFLLLPLANDLRQSSYWPALGKMMNSPRSNG